ncbi:MAG: serine/threonine protein phosphatase [Deltaproteobacteria bacterium]|nr:serine/threonine protein phosphatase [Deltaproteobacteria bacterium]
MIAFHTDPYQAEQQLRGVIFYLTAVGFVDGDFDATERELVRGQIAGLVDARARQVLGAGIGADVTARWKRHFDEVFEEVVGQVERDLDEPTAEGEAPQQFALSRLRLKCFELFRTFDPESRRAMLEAADAVIRADGVVHPAEAAFRDELVRVLDAPMELGEDEVQELPEGSMHIASARKLPPKAQDHPFLKGFEWDWARDPALFAEQSRGDMALIDRVVAHLEAQRARGRGRLGEARDFAGFSPGTRFLDGHVYVDRPAAGEAVDLLVIGDLHGCYSCLKAALLQADFFARVQAAHDAPGRHPAMKLVLLGDYIDRGRFSYNGVLRTVMQLQLAAPDSVYMLRGNHEHYVELNGKVLAPVRPAEAMQSLESVAGVEVFARYMKLFEALPNMLVFDRTLFVHAGIPRDETIARVWTGLSSLNDPELRFEMLWSDPSAGDHVPAELQAASARFPFGRRQFKSFLGRLGVHTMIRGHERVVEGFRRVYDEPGARLLSLFSAGGRTNGDLPPRSSYREVTPMALLLKYREGVTELEPFEIAYERFNDPQYNAFFAKADAGSGER